MNWYRKAQVREYPVAGSTVSGLRVLPGVPNESSIDSTLIDYVILQNIREVPMSDFDISGRGYSVSENERIVELQEEIKRSKTISPLIVVIEPDGPYILEGSHRIDALYNLGVPTFPALVVLDKERE
jgi:hypothetical protein